MQNCSDILFFSAGKTFRKNCLSFTSLHLFKYRQIIAFCRFTDTATIRKIALAAFGIYLYINACLHNIRLMASGFYCRCLLFEGYSPQSAGYSPQSAGYSPKDAGYTPQGGDCITLKYLKSNMNNFMLNLNLYSYEQ
jgi:hypothetical protein